MKKTQRTIGLIIASLFVLALALGLSIRVFAQSGQAVEPAGPDSSREGSWTSPPDNLTINPALPETQKPLEGTAATGISSREIPPFAADAEVMRQPDRVSINPYLPENLNGFSTPPGFGAGSSAEIQRID
jgi:hypothetical protein